MKSANELVQQMLNDFSLKLRHEGKQAQIQKVSLKSDRLDACSCKYRPLDRGGSLNQKGFYNQMLKTIRPVLSRHIDGAKGKDKGEIRDKVI